MVDLRTNYLGLNLKNPLVASASPLSEKIEKVKQFEQSGVSAIVLYSLFEEQILRENEALDEFLSFGIGSSAESAFLPDIGRYKLGPEVYINHIKNVKKAVSIPVIASLNGVSTGGWIEYAQKIEQAGADALELNIYFLPTDLNLAGSELEDAYTQLVADIRAEIHIPLAVKLSPYFTSVPNIAQRLIQAGADGLVFFNRFYQPDLDLEQLEVVPNLELSNSYEMRVPLRWIALLYKRLSADFALTGGVHNGIDMVKSLMAGASVTMVASEFLKHGIARASAMLEEVESWMAEHEYESVSQMKGSLSQQAGGQPVAFERANYMKVLSSYKG